MEPFVLSTEEVLLAHVIGDISGEPVRQTACAAGNLRNNRCGQGRERGRRAEPRV